VVEGGVLVGQSPELLKFFKQIVDAAPAGRRALRSKYLGSGGRILPDVPLGQAARHASYKLPEDVKFKADIIDTLAMSITPVAGTLSGKVDIALPVKPYLAIRLTRIDTGTSSM